MQGTINKFDTSSTRFCNVCKIEVKLAFGGEANWPGHEHTSNVCADDGCEAGIDDTQYHLSCQGLFDKPVGGWFCNDDECKKNAGYQVGGGWKHRRRG